MFLKVSLVIIGLYLLIGLTVIMGSRHQYFVAHKNNFCTAEFSTYYDKQFNGASNYCTNNEFAYLVKVLTTPYELVDIVLWPLMVWSYGFCPPNAGSC